jgi:hypothetical protein
MLKKIAWENIPIVTLCFSALILLILIARMDSSAPATSILPSAVASGMTASSGSYVITVGSLTDRDEEMVYVVDSAAQRLASYRFDSKSKQLELIQQLNLEDMRRRADELSKPSPGK